MTRPCTEYEKEILYKNRGDILSGTFKPKNGNGAAFVIGLIVGMIMGVLIGILSGVTNKQTAKLFLLRLL